jgi:hypothetical protein
LAKNEEGEFELVLGNRQLVSVFLIVVILLGVFFSMGYIVGRNSAPAVSADASTRNTSPSKPIVVDNPARAGQSPAESAQSAKPAAPEEPQPEAKKPEPVSEAPLGPASKMDEAKPAPAPAAQPPAAQPPANTAPSAAGAVSYEEPHAGQTFLQVLATDRADADAIAEMLVKRGFKTTVAPSSIANKFRVLVGPTRNASELSETRSKLEGAGFKPIVQRY